MLESKYLHLMHTFVDVCKEGDKEKRKAMLYNLDISNIHEGATSFLNSMVSSRTLPYYLLPRFGRKDGCKERYHVCY